MLAAHRVAVPLRLFLAGLFAILVFFESVSLPGQFASMAEESPDLADVRWPLTAVSVFCVVCAQVVLVATWRLLTYVQRDRIFSAASLAWVDAIAGAIAAAWVVLLGVFLWFAPQFRDPAPPLLLMLLLAGVGVVGLVVLVLRALLRQATDLRTDLEAVI